MMTETRTTHGVAGEAETLEPITEDELRARTYSLLSHLLYGPPDETMTRRLTSIEESRDSATPLATAWSTLGDAARRTTPQSLQQEYQDLFIGLGQGEVVPYGSWYLTGFLMEQPLSELRADLRVLGIERAAGVREPEDHAAGLCAVMALLAMGEPATAVEQQRQFFERHLAPWVPQFFRDLQQAPSARFYRAVGQLGERFIEVEQHAFSMSLPPADHRRPGGRKANGTTRARDPRDSLHRGSLSHEREA